MSGSSLKNWGESCCGWDWDWDCGGGCRFGGRRLERRGRCADMCGVVFGHGARGARMRGMEGVKADILGQVRLSCEL